MQISSGSFSKSMNPPISFIFLIVALLLSSASAIAQAEGVQFGYDSRTNGPNRWGNLNPQYKKCAVGKLQSPINILKRLTFYDRNLGRLITDYHPTNATLVNHICNVAMLYEKGGGSLVIEGKNYTLKQMHWHTPSEHQINGVRLAAELHLVHEAEDGSLAVVATLYRLGKEDPFLSKVKDKLAELAKEKYENIQTAQVAVGVINPKHVERRNRKYYRYVGSLTTPPCTENVIWTILGKVRSISKEQVELLESPLDRSYKVNARPVQSLNGRRVEMYHELELPVKHRKHEKKMKKN